MEHAISRQFNCLLDSRRGKARKPMLQLNQFSEIFTRSEKHMIIRSHESPLPFNETKATQAAAYLLKLEGGRMNYMKLIKLLYLADRKALLTWRRPVTTDRYVSMKCGPVLSRVYGFISQGSGNSLWEAVISRYGQYEVSLEYDPGDSDLSEADITVLDEIFFEYGKISNTRLVDLTHELPEWRNPGRSSTPISYGDILKAGGANESEIGTFENELASARNRPDILQRIEDEQDVYVAEQRLRHPFKAYSSEEVKRELGL